MLLLSATDFLTLVVLDVVDAASLPAVVTGVDTGLRLIELTIGGDADGLSAGALLLSRMDGLHPEPDAVERWAAYVPNSPCPADDRARLARADVISMGAAIRHAVRSGKAVTGGASGGVWLPLSDYAEKTRKSEPLSQAIADSSQLQAG